MPVWFAGHDFCELTGEMGIRSDSSGSLPVRGEVEVTLDGLLVELPPERHSLTAVCSFLEALALQRQRILYSLTVDGEFVNPAQPPTTLKSFVCVEGKTLGLEDVPAQLLEAALLQTANARARVESAVALVLINDDQHARELWWSLAKDLKEPLVTVSLLPETICGPANGRASLMQLRKWQLQQLGCVIGDVDKVCRAGSSVALSDALEKRALPWLQKLNELLRLWHQTVLAGSRAACHKA
jgi:hypothetical protein